MPTIPPPAGAIPTVLPAATATTVTATAPATTTPASVLVPSTPPVPAIAPGVGANRFASDAKGCIASSARVPSATEFFTNKLQALSSKSVQERTAAAHAIRDTISPTHPRAVTAAPVLLDFLATPTVDEAAKNFVRQALAKIPAIATTQCIAALTDPRTQMRATAARVLESVGNHSALEPLLRLLANLQEEEKVSFTAINAIARICANPDRPLTLFEIEPAIHQLSMLAERQNAPEINRTQAIRALGKIGSFYAARGHDDMTEQRGAALADRLLQLAASRFLHEHSFAHTTSDPEDNIRIAALRAINSIGISTPKIEAFTTDLLTGVARAPHLQAFDSYRRYVVYEAVALAGKLEISACEPAVLGLLMGPHTEYHGVAITALGQLRSHAALKPLVACLQHQDSLLREFAVRALGRIGDRTVVDRLKPLLKDPAANVKNATIDAIGAITGQRPW